MPVNAERSDTDVLISNGLDLDGAPLSLRLRHGSIAERAPSLAAHPDERVIDAKGCTVIPGLHDHHVHLRSAAASLDSIQLGPPVISTHAQAVRAVQTAHPRADGWVRAVGYHESVAGHLDRGVLDHWRSDVPVRVQHRSGALWIVNSAGLHELDQADHPDGLLFRRDADVGRRAGDTGGNLTAIGKLLSALGVTGCTDATPDMGSATIDYFDEEIRTGRFRQNVHLLTRRDHTKRAVTFGPVKRILDDTDLVLDDLVAWIRDVHDADQSIAVHCVTVAQLVLTMVALRSTGIRPGDRIEHAAMVPSDALEELAELGVTVVTSPNFISERGEQYLRDIDASCHHQLWRVASLVHAGVSTACGTDAPFGDIDPWACMRAARTRSSPSGAVIGAAERIGSRQALDMFLGAADSPTRLRLLQPGHSADLCILAATPSTVLADLSADLVRTTIVRGEVVFRR